MPGQQPPPHSNEVLRCSFCGKSQDEARKLIAGPSAFICDDCVWVSLEIVAEGEQETFEKVVANIRSSFEANEDGSPPKVDSRIRHDNEVTPGETCVTIYMPLLNEGADAWAPVLAERIRNKTYRVLGVAPDGQEWEYPTGTVVRCALIISPDDQTALAAVERAKAESLGH